MRHFARQQVYAERKVAKPWRDWWVHRFRLLNRIKSTREVSSSVPFQWSFTSRSGSSTFSSRERNNKRNNNVFTSLELKIDGGRNVAPRYTHTHRHTRAHTTVGGERSRRGIEGNTVGSYTTRTIVYTGRDRSYCCVYYSIHVSYSLHESVFPPADWYSRRLQGHHR